MQYWGITLNPSFVLQNTNFVYFLHFTELKFIMTSFHQKLCKSFFAFSSFFKKLAGVRLFYVLQRHGKVTVWIGCSCCYLTKNSVSLLHSVTTTFGTSRGLSRWCSTLALEWKKKTRTNEKSHLLHE